MKKRNPIFRKIFGVLLLAPVLSLALLQTPPGKALLATGLSRMLSGSENRTVKIGKMSGWIPAAIQIDRLEVGDAEGAWLSAEGLHCRWMMRELLDHRIRLAKLGAETIEIHRLPQANPPADRTPQEFLPPEIVLDEVEIGQLKLGKAVAGLALKYSVYSGGIRLQPSGRFSGKLKVGGDAVGEVELDALIGNPTDNRLSLIAELEQMTRPRMGLDHLSGRAEMVISDREGLSGSLTVLVQRDGLEAQVATQIEYFQQRLQLPAFEITVAEHTLQGELSAEVSMLNTRWIVQLNALKLQGFNVLDLSLTGTLSKEQLALRGELAEFGLNVLPVPALSNFTGRVGGALALTGSLSKPALAAELDVVRFSSAEDALDELPPLDFHVSGRLADGEVTVFSAITNSTTGRMETDVKMPCAFSLLPFIFKPEAEAVYAAFHADIDLSVFNRLALLNDQRVAGELVANLVYDHKLSGEVRVDRGAYEHFKWGVVVRDVEVALAASGEGLRVVDTATATDGGSGRVSLTGGVASNQWALALNLKKAAVLRRDEVEGTLSGRITVAGPLARPEVAGALVVDRAEILLDHIAPALPPLLLDYDAHSTTQRVAVVKKRRKPLPFELDVQLDLADQIFVNASMIDSVWGGNLRVQGRPEGLSVRGEIKPRRGYVSFIGKKFRFTEGKIELDGGIPMEPVLNPVAAEYSRSDITARLVLSGRLNNPDFRLESTPAMPEDEVLSHVLFGRDTSSITPYQAYQIAAAARQLSGGMNGPGFMYKMRRAVGIDTLEWREGAANDDASSVAAGKYLTPALYVEVNRALDEKGEIGMVAEYEITKHVSVETSTGPKMRPGIGVNWKNDY